MQELDLNVHQIKQRLIKKGKHDIASIVVEISESDWMQLTWDQAHEKWRRGAETFVWETYKYLHANLSARFSDLGDFYCLREKIIN